MEISGTSLDDLLIELYKALPSQGLKNRGSRGENTELLGVTLRLENPRARLSRSEDRGKPFSAIGELLWYLSGSDKLEFIEPYIPRYRNDAEEGILPGAYGPRLFAMDGGIDQLSNVANLLKERPGSRRAVVQLFCASDLVTHRKEIPCTTTLQFHLREGKLHMSTNMRSNDAYYGLPHDVFCFTMLQEMMARRLGAALGNYIHHAGSMHVYDEVLEGALAYIDEGYQRPNEMPEMPMGNPFELVPNLLGAEARARAGDRFSVDEIFRDSYWSDFARLIQCFWARRMRFDLSELKGAFHSEMYAVYANPLPVKAQPNAPSAKGNQTR